jgi:hypothetical protein
LELVEALPPLDEEPSTQDWLALLGSPGNYRNADNIAYVKHLLTQDYERSGTELSAAKWFIRSARDLQQLLAPWTCRYGLGKIYTPDQAGSRGDVGIDAGPLRRTFGERGHSPPLGTHGVGGSEPASPL